MILNYLLLLVQGTVAALSQSLRQEKGLSPDFDVVLQVHK